MKLLVDSSALYWWWTQEGLLSRRATEALRDNASDLFVSAATAWEFATKHRIGKLPGAEAFMPDFAKLLRESRITPLAVELDHALEAGRLSGVHRDPFDRMLAAQALIEGMAIVSADRVFTEFGVKVIW